MSRTIQPHGWTIHDNGYVERHDVSHSEPSAKWRITGAVERNNFGGAVEWYSLADVLADPSAIPWQFGNGKQRTFLTQFDHGTNSELTSPGYTVA
jgi:hypothetical protein